MSLRAVFLCCFAIAGVVSLRAEQAALGALRDIPFDQLSDRNLSRLGEAALGIRAADWKHAESPNFVYHFFQSFIATPVSTEAEFYYRITARELEKDTTQWERKCHIFIFEKADDWAQFQNKGSLDPWTGGIHAGGELFIQRNPELRWKGSTLAHEVAHLVVNRFFGAGVPLWLNEGYAEYAGSRGYSTFHRARGYAARPVAQAVNPARFIPLTQLTVATRYPSEVTEVATFYDESERLVRFLSGVDKRGFGNFFDALSKGNRLETALSKGFGSRFMNLEALEREFKEYATKEHGSAMQD